METRISRPETGSLPETVEALPPVRPFGPLEERWLGDNRVSSTLKSQWIEEGYAVLEGAFSRDQIDRYNAIVAGVRREVDDGKDAHGYGDRIGQLHQKEPDLLELAASKEILDFLAWAFDDEPVVFGSLNFERGTQQDAHIDAIFFWPEPSYSMAGCWIALEDIEPDAGPLFYIPGSHRWPFYHSEHVVTGRPDLAARRQAARAGTLPAAERGPLVGALGAAWTQDLRALETRYGSERRPLALKAGDAVFWHSLLAHGGSPRVNPALSRRSVVFHYIGRNTKLYTFEQFMLNDSTEISGLQPQGKDLRTYKDRLSYMRYPHFVTYANGREIVNPLGG